MTCRLPCLVNLLCYATHKSGHEWALWPCDSSIGLLTKFESTNLEESSLECEEGRKSKQASKQAYVWWTWHHLGYLSSHSQNNLYLTSTSPYILFYQTVHLYYTTWRWTTFIGLNFPSMKGISNRYKRFDSWEFNEETTFCCLVTSIEWTSTYIRNTINSSVECVYMVSNISFV